MPAPGGCPALAKEEEAENGAFLLHSSCQLAGVAPTVPQGPPERVWRGVFAPVPPQALGNEPSGCARNEARLPVWLAGACVSRGSRGWGKRHAGSVVALAVLLAAVGRAVAVLGRWIVGTETLPQWDMAAHGVAGLRLAQALARLDLWGFVAEVNALSTWPPVFPLLETPVFLLFGSGYEVPRWLVCGLFAAAVLAAWWAGSALAGEADGPAVGLLAAACLCASPFHQAFAALVMLEVPGTLLLLLAFGSYCRSLRGARAAAAWRWTCIASTALFFCKYNYGLLWLLPMVASELRRRTGSWWALGSAALARLAALDPRQPWTWLLGLYLAGLIWIRVSGGIAWEILGVEVRATSIGNPVYVLYLAFMLGLLLRWPRSGARWRQLAARLGPRWRTFALWVALPIALWRLVPPQTKDFFGFVENRSAGMGLRSLESLLFYPRALITEYAADPRWGTVLLLLGLAPLAAWRRLDDRVRVLMLAILCSGLALWVHPYKLPRFAATLAPLVWLSAAWTVAASVRWWCERRRPPAAAAAGVSAVVLALALALLAPGVDRRRLEAQLAVRTVPATVRPVVDRLVEHSVEEEGSVLLGSWNLLSPALVEWHLRQRYPSLAETRTPGTWRRIARSRAAEPMRRGLATRRRIRRLLLAAAPGPPTAATVGFREATAWLVPVRGALASGAGWQLHGTEDFPASGYRLEDYRRPPSPP